MGHSAQTRSEAVDALRTHDAAEVHEQTGVPLSTLRRWARAEGIDLLARSQAKTKAATEAARDRWAEIRAEMANESGDTARRLLELVSEAIDDGDIEITSARDAKDAATAVGILVDKAQVLGGDVSDRVEHLGLRDELVDRAKADARHLRSVPA